MKSIRSTTLLSALLSSVSLFASLFFSTGALAAPSVSVGAVAAQGQSCASGNVSAAISANGSQLVVKFQQFGAAANAPANLLNLWCSLKIPLQAPAGFQVMAMRTNYQGQLGKGVVATLKSQVRMGSGAIAIHSKVLNGPLSFSETNPNNSAWSGCAAPVVLEDHIILGINNPGAILDSATYSLAYQPCQSMPASNFSLLLGGNAASGWTLSGVCDVGHKIKLTAHHSSYVVGQPSKSAPFAAAEFEDYCGGTHTIPNPPQKSTYKWAGPLPPTGTFGTVVFSNTPPAPQGANFFKPGTWQFEAHQVEATAMNPSWPRTVFKPPTVQIP
jgi:hypothetical protein